MREPRVIRYLLYCRLCSLAERAYLQQRYDSAAALFVDAATHAPDAVEETDTLNWAWKALMRIGDREPA
jgi:hypothetical protein